MPRVRTRIEVDPPVALATYPVDGVWHWFQRLPIPGDSMTARPVSRRAGGNAITALFTTAASHLDTTKYILGSMNTVISIKVDKDVKEAAQEVARSAGLTLSSLVNAYLRQVVATRRIELYAPEPMTPRLEELIAEVESELNAGKASKPFENVDDFLADLKQ